MAQFVLSVFTTISGSLKSQSAIHSTVLCAVKYSLTIPVGQTRG